MSIVICISLQLHYPGNVGAKLVILTTGITIKSPIIIIIMYRVCSVSFIYNSKDGQAFEDQQLYSYYNIIMGLHALYDYTVLITHFYRHNPWEYLQLCCRKQRERK